MRRGLRFYKTHFSFNVKSEIFQHFLKPFPRKKYSALYGSYREIQLLCNFLIFIPGNMHGKRYFVLIGKTIDRLVNLLDRISSVGGI